MLKTFLTIASFLIVATVSSGTAHAAGTVALQGDVYVVRVEVLDGEAIETLARPDKVVPGDKLIFTTAYANETGEPVDNFVVTNPLPAAVTLSTDDGFSVSVDGGQTFGRLALLKVSADGTDREATLTDVTHVRWTLPRLEVGEKGILKYQAVVR